MIDFNDIDIEEINLSDRKILSVNYDLDEFTNNIENYKVGEKITVKVFYRKRITNFDATILYKNSNVITLEFDVYINGHNGREIFKSGKDGHCWNLGINRSKIDTNWLYGKLIDEKLI